MKLFVRICSITIAVALVFGVFSTVMLTDVSAEVADITIENKEVYEGQDCSVDIAINRDDVCGAQFTVKYDNTKLSLKSITTNLDDKFVLSVNAKRTDDSFSVIFSGDTAVTEGVVATVKFIALSTESDIQTNLEFTDILLVNSSCETITDNAPSSTIKIKHIYNRPEKELSIVARSVSLTSEVSLKVIVDRDFENKYGYSNLHMKFAVSGRAPGKEYDITPEVYNNKYYMFVFHGINPYEFSQEITFTLYGTYSGIEFQSPEKKYSIINYCANTLAKNTVDNQTKKLIADMLNYGAAAQIYTAKHTDNLCNEDESVANYIALYETKDNPDLKTLDNKEFEKIDSPTLNWQDAELKLENSISMSFAFTTDEDLSDIEIKIYGENEELKQTYTQSDFEKITTQNKPIYRISFKGYGVGYMSRPVYVKAYKNGNIISNTYRYSIESYAYRVVNSSNSSEDFKNLCYAMMKYGNTAAVFFN